jgi:hypothetical protein
MFDLLLIVSIVPCMFMLLIIDCQFLVFTKRVILEYNPKSSFFISALIVLVIKYLLFKIYIKLNLYPKNRKASQIKKLRKNK